MAMLLASASQGALDPLFTITWFRILATLERDRRPD